METACSVASQRYRPYACRLIRFASVFQCNCESRGCKSHDIGISPGSFRSLNNARNILDYIGNAHRILEDASIERAVSDIESAMRYDEELKEIYDELLDAQAVLEAALKDIGTYADELDVDEQALKETEDSATADYPDANSIFAFQVDPEGFSKCYWTSYTNDEAVELLHEGQTVPDGDERAEVYEKLQQLLADEVPMMFLFLNKFSKKLATPRVIHWWNIRLSWLWRSIIHI